MYTRNPILRFDDTSIPERQTGGPEARKPRVRSSIRRTRPTQTTLERNFARGTLYNMTGSPSASERVACANDCAMCPAGGYARVYHTFTPLRPHTRLLTQSRTAIADGDAETCSATW
jgi:hypothetical protein